jgi:ATP:ADP antiporter, AAA family
MPLTLARTNLAPMFDVRSRGERATLIGFAGLLMLIIAAHTLMETARDALLLTGPGPRALGFVYMIIAMLALPCASLASRAGARFGQRRALAGTVAIAVLAAVSLFFLPPTHATAIAVYVVSGLIGSIVVPQFWTLLGNGVTVAQARRLFSLISAAGIVGGVIGSGTAGAALAFVPVKGLLLVSAGVFVVAGLVLARLPVGPDSTPRFVQRTSVASSLRAFREQPFLLRVALLVALSTATFLTIDYYFKSTIAHALPAAAVGPFVARYYLVLNGISFLVQVFLGSAIVRRMGIVAAVGLTPLLLAAGGIGALATGGTMAAVLLLKGIDGSLRHSIHRITGELVYLPVPAVARQRAKPLIDGGLGRTVQTLTGAALLALGGTQVLSPRPFAVTITVLALAWLLTAATIRRSYLALLWRGLSKGTLDIQESPDPLDVETVDLLVQSLASDDTLEVLGAMNALSRRGRDGVVPALLLLHPDASVLIHALEIFGASSRSDWITLGHRLLDDPRDAVRMAAARALAKHERLDSERLARNAGSRVRGYAAVDSALRAGIEDVTHHPPLAGMLAQPDEESKLGMLAAVADAPSTARLWPLLLRLGSEGHWSLEKTELLALAATKQQDERIVPHLIALLSVREGREAVRSALVALGAPAFDEVARVLGDPSQPHRLRIHMPKTLARFQSKRAIERLLAAVETDADGLVRYKALRALAALTAEGRFHVDRGRVEKLEHAQLVRYFEILRLRAPLEASPTAPASAAGRLLLALLDDKAQHARERAFLLLQIAHPGKDVRSVRVACACGNAYTRANAGELLDALLRRRDQQGLRELFRLIADDLTLVERVDRAANLVPGPAPATRDEALMALVRHPDGMVSTLAALHTLDVGNEPLRAAVDRARRERAAANPAEERLLSGARPPREPDHA